MTTLKIWTKPTIEVTNVRSAQHMANNHPADPANTGGTLGGTS